MTNTGAPIETYAVPFSGLAEDKHIEQVKNDLQDRIEGNKGVRLAIDLSQTFYISSRAIGMLVVIRRDIIKLGGRIVLYGLNPSVERVFRITRLYEQLNVCKDAAAAEESFSQAAPEPT